LRSGKNSGAFSGSLVQLQPSILFNGRTVRVVKNKNRKKFRQLNIELGSRLPSGF
jgi:hypothetical protein